MLFTWIFYLRNMSLHEVVLFLRTAQLWVESSRQGPFGRCSIGRGANSGKVSLLHVPHLTTEVTPALHYASALLHGPPAHPPPFAVD